MRSYCLTLFLLVLAGTVPAMAGTFQLARTGDNYTLEADQARLSDILTEIDRQEPAALRFFGTYDQTVSTTYRDVSLDTLLYRLGVSYVLTYEADEDGNYRLDDAMMLDSGEAGVDAATAATIRKLVRDLRDDDIRGNAQNAIYELYQLGCTAVPFLEEALLDTDFQGRHVAADLLRGICPDYRASDLLISLIFELLDSDGLDYNLQCLLSSGSAFDFLESSNIYPRVRGRILQNLYSKDGRTRLYSALIAAQHRETAMTETLVRIMAPHLADNDLHNDAAACVFALHHLGPAVLPYLRPYRHSTDVQQAELVNLICTALETGAIPDFAPTMYASYNRMPIEGRPYINVNRWNRDRFPDEAGRYHDLSEPRMTVADYYGTGFNSSHLVWHDELRPLEEIHKTPEVRGHYYDPHDKQTRDPDVEEPFPYIVKLGDTLDSISLKFATTPQDINRLNPRLPHDRSVEPGMKTLIPWQ